MSEEQSTEVEESEETKVEEQETQNPLFQSLFDAAKPEQEAETPLVAPQPSSLTEALHDIEKEPEVEIANEQVEEEETKQEQPESGEPPEAAKPKKKVKKVKQVIDPEIPKVEETQPEAPAFAEESEQQKIIKNLIPEEKEYYDMAKFASDNMEEHRGLDEEFLEYFKKSKNYVEKRLKDDP
jgi:hypothetical protein